MNRLARCGLVPVLAAALGLAGCAPSAPNASTAAISTPRPRVVSRSQFDEIVAAQRGKPVLVDFWASWCGPCLEQLPHTAELARRHGDQLAVITVSMDDAEDLAAIERQLADRRADATINLVAEVAGPRGMEAFEVEGGALPHYKLFDREGELQQTFGVDPSAEKQFTHEDVAQAAEKLLAP